MSGGMEFSFGFSPSGQRREPGLPLRILIFSDLSGSTARGPLRDRKPIPVGVDTLDTRFAALNPSARLSDEVVLSFESLDDLHPDRIFQTAEIFRSFRELRARLSNPATFADAAAELTQAAGESATRSGQTGESAAESSRSAEDAAELTRTTGETTSAPPANDFERLLHGGGAGLPAPTSKSPMRSASKDPSRVVDDLIARIMAPHVQAVPDPRQAPLLAAVDHAIADTMRAVLEHPAVRGLERTWLGLSRLVRGIEGENAVELFVLDVSMTELFEAMQTAPSENVLHRSLVASQQAPGTTPWSLWVADVPFGASADDLRVLGALGSLAASAGAPLLADASPALLGIEEFGRSEDPASWPGATEDLASTWDALRASEVAPWIGLTAPRILLRLPYGEKTDPIESIRFEEMPDPQTASYVWGSSALAVAQLAANSFAWDGWGFRAPDGADIGDIPVHIYEEGGEKRARPTAEAYLGERAADALLRTGIIPILSIRGRDAARVVRVQSIAHPAAALRGPWA